MSTLDKIGERHGLSLAVISLAWLLGHPARIVPIVGSVSPGRITDAIRADTVDLSREEWYRILVAARMQGLP